MSEAIFSDETIIEFYGEKAIRWYQAACREGIFQALTDKIKRVIVVLPTGAGKTITIACSLEDDRIRQLLGVTDDRPLRVLFVSHKNRLLTQAERAFVDATGIELITQSMFSEIPDEVVERGWDIAVLDEGHHESCLSFQLQLERVGERPIIYLTATPVRPDGLIIKANRIINPLSREQAVKEGYLAETYLHSIVDTSATNKTPMLREVIDKFGTEMGQTMVFVRTKNEVREVAAHLALRGYSAVALLEQNDKEVDRVLEAFSAGTVQFVVNCNKISEGVDVVGCSDVLLGRQFGSYTQLNQVIGRAARPDSDCNVWEFVNPLSGRNLDTTVVVGTPKSHRLIYKRKDAWNIEQFDYTSIVR
jgi:superfamily II DNA or RNA helicase